MKKHFVLVTLLSFVGLAVAAHAQEKSMTVDVPFEFVAGVATLPAGTYTVARASSELNSPLIISTRDRGFFLLPVAFDDIPTDKVQLRFELVGNAHLLSAVKTPLGTYSIDTRQAISNLTKLAQTKTPAGNVNGMTSSGTP